MAIANKIATLVTLLISCVYHSTAAPVAPTLTEITSFSIAKSPSGLFFDADGSYLLYVLCGTQTNGDHYLYAYTTDGEELCEITIPQEVGMSRVDGFYISQMDSKAYIVDSQGTIYAEEGDQYLGGSVYQVEWTDPCGCATGICTSNSVEWIPTLTEQWSVDVTDISTEEGGGVDVYFRNSGIVVVGSSWYGVNGVHPVDGTLTSEYPKSIVEFDMTTSSVVNNWAFDGSTIGHDIDMEGMTCGPDACTTYLYVGDEYNYIYEFELESGTVTAEWDLNSIVGNIPVDKGIEALTYASNTGYFYAGIQETRTIHVLILEGGTVAPTNASSTAIPPTTPADFDAQLATTLSDCYFTDEFPQCTAPTIPLSEKRIRREVRSLTSEQWNKVVAAMWIMKDLSMEEGKNLYGDAFRSYDYFVLKHVVATTDIRGDQAHFGAHFMTWHLAFVMEFENVLLAIDPTIEGAPYWDECLTEPSVFTDDYFGTDATADPYQIVDGKFAYWPVETNFSMDDWVDYIFDFSTVTFYGGGPTLTYLRAANNGETSQYAVRYGSGTGWESSITSTFTYDWWDCTSSSVAEWNDWYACMEAGNPPFHGGPHDQIGGSAENAGGSDRPENGDRPEGGEPPEGGTPSNGDTAPQGNDAPPVRHFRQLQENNLIAIGDFADFASSPNGAIFMFHHANLDRNRLWWMRRHSSEAEVCRYYGFPLTDAPYIHKSIIEGGAAFDGAHLNDVVSSSWGFTLKDLGLVTVDSDTSSGQVTHADILCWFNPESSPYTYDTNVACLEDESQCHGVQSLFATSPPTASHENDSDSDTASSSSFTEIMSFSTAKSPSGLFFDADGSYLLYVLCGTQTNGDHYLYAYTTDGEELCEITIPQEVGMSRVDGFYISQMDSKAYIVDSQGTIYAEEGDQYLGGSVYQVEWTDPCGCATGICTSNSVEWIPTLTEQWSVDVTDISTEEGGGVDVYFRNSGIVVVGSSWYGVNGVHPVDGTLTSEYPKSIVEFDMTTSSVVNNWAFDGSTIGHDVDMEGMTCGPDACTTYLYVGDEYNYIYEFELESGTVTAEWDLNSIVGNIPVDKGIEALTYASNTGYFYAGIQGTQAIHVINLNGLGSSGDMSMSTSAPSESADESRPIAPPVATPVPDNDTQSDDVDSSTQDLRTTLNLIFVFVVLSQNVLGL